MVMILILILLSISFIMISLDKNFLSFLILVEYMVVSMLFFMVYFCNINVWIYLIYLVLTVCEAVLGLSLMVSMTFCFGHQKIEILNLCS